MLQEHDLVGEFPTLCHLEKSSGKEINSVSDEILGSLPCVSFPSLDLAAQLQTGVPLAFLCFIITCFHRNFFFPFPCWQNLDLTKRKMLHEGPLTWKVNRDKTIGESGPSLAPLALGEFAGKERREKLCCSSQLCFLLPPLIMPVCFSELIKLFLSILKCAGVSLGPRRDTAVSHELIQFHL